MSSSSEENLTCINNTNILDLLKQHARICDNDSDTLLQAYINTAKSVINHVYGIYIDEQVLTETFSCTRHIYLQRYPSSIISVTYVKNGSIVNAEYIWDNKQHIICDDGLEHTLTITYNVGYNCYPPEIVQSILLLASYYYDNRSNSLAQSLTNIPDGVDMLLPPRINSSL